MGKEVGVIKTALYRKQNDLHFLKSLLMSRHRFLKYATTELKKKVLVGGMKVYSYTIELGIIEQLITVVLVIL